MYTRRNQVTVIKKYGPLAWRFGGILQLCLSCNCQPIFRQNFIKMKRKKTAESVLMQGVVQSNFIVVPRLVSYRIIDLENYLSELLCPGESLSSVNSARNIHIHTALFIYHITSVHLESVCIAGVSGQLLATCQIMGK